MTEPKKVAPTKTLDVSYIPKAMKENIYKFFLSVIQNLEFRFRWNIHGTLIQRQVNTELGTKYSIEELKAVIKVVQKDRYYERRKARKPASLRSKTLISIKKQEEPEEEEENDEMSKLFASFFTNAQTYLNTDLLTMETVKMDNLLTEETRPLIETGMQNVNDQIRAENSSLFTTQRRSHVKRTLQAMEENQPKRLKLHPLIPFNPSLFPQEWNVRQDPELKITGEIGQKKAQYKKLLAAILDAQEKLQRLEDDKQKLENMLQYLKRIDFQGVDPTELQNELKQTEELLKGLYEILMVPNGLLESAKERRKLKRISIEEREEDPNQQLLHYFQENNAN